jgi:hypothetical protein
MHQVMARGGHQQQGRHVSFGPIIGDPTGRFADRAFTMYLEKARREMGDHLYALVPINHIHSPLCYLIPVEFELAYRCVLKLKNGSPANFVNQVKAPQTFLKIVV